MPNDADLLNLLGRWVDAEPDALSASWSPIHSFCAGPSNSKSLQSPATARLHDMGPRGLSSPSALTDIGPPAIWTHRLPKGHEAALRHFVTCAPRGCGSGRLRVRRGYPHHRRTVGAARRRQDHISQVAPAGRPGAASRSTGRGWYSREHSLRLGVVHCRFALPWMHPIHGAVWHLYRCGAGVRRRYLPGRQRCPTPPRMTCDRVRVRFRAEPRASADATPPACNHSKQTSAPG